MSRAVFVSRVLFPSLAVSLCITALLGCGSTSTTTTTSVPGVVLPGRVFGAQQPVIGAKVYLYAAGATGKGSPSVSLLKTSAIGVLGDSSGNGYLTTDANGSFDISGDWTCANGSDQVYLLALGGNPGLAAGTNNGALALMSGLGTCSSLASSYPSMVINEVTTVAAVWALQQFMLDGSHIGRSASNVTGLANAFSLIANLVNGVTGQALAKTPAGNGVVPQGKIDTLGNLLAPCVYSTGAASTACTSLISAGSVTGGTTATNTVGIAMEIAQNPGNKVAGLFGLLAATGTFQPQLAAAPNDWMLSVIYTGGGLNGPASLAVDASGNAWVADYGGAASAFSPVGAPLSANGYAGLGLTENFGLAIDVSNNIWLANEQSTGGINSNLGSVTKISSSGQLLSGSTGYSAGGIYFPVAVAADPNGNMWVVNYGDSRLTLLNSSGVPVSAAGGWGGSSLQFPAALAVDSNHNAWVANQSANSITKVSADGSTNTVIQCCNGASGIATDQSNNVWVTNYYGDSVSEVNSGGVVLLSQLGGGGLQHPLGIAIDGAGTVWTVNYRGGSISELSGSASKSPGTILSPSSGFGTDASLLEPYGIALDASGNVWVSSFGNNAVAEFIGIASPIRTPFAGPPATP